MKIFSIVFLMHGFVFSAHVYDVNAASTNPKKILKHLKYLEKNSTDQFKAMKYKPDELVQVEKLLKDLFADVNLLINKKSQKKQKSKNRLTPHQALTHMVHSVDEFSKLQQGLYQKFYATFYHLGSTVAGIRVAAASLSKEEHERFRRQCDVHTLRLIGPLENYFKVVLDYIFVMKDHDTVKKALNDVAFDITTRMQDGPFLAYGLKVKSEPPAEQISTVKSTAAFQWFGFYQQNDGSFFLVYQFAISKNLMIAIANTLDKDEKPAKIYCDFAPAPDGLLFVETQGKIYFSTYRNGDSFAGFSHWESVDNVDNARGLIANDRFHYSYMPSYDASLNFIEYHDVDGLDDALGEIKKEGMLDSSVILDLILWLMGEELPLSVGVQIPSFYPKKLAALKRDELKREQQKIDVRAARTIDKTFANSLPRVRDYAQMFSDMVDVQGSLNNSLFKKCVKAFLKKNANDVEEDVDQTGSHIQARGKKGNKSTTVVVPHGAKAKRGTPASEVRKMLTLPDHDRR